MTNCRNKMAPV